MYIVWWIVKHIRQSFPTAPHLDISHTTHHATIDPHAHTQGCVGCLVPASPRFAMRLREGEALAVDWHLSVVKVIFVFFETTWGFVYKGWTCVGLDL